MWWPRFSMDMAKYPEVFGCEVVDVMRLLPNITVDDSLANVPSNPRYMGSGRSISSADVEAFIRMVSQRVNARLWKFDSTPERFRDNIRIMANDAVTNGAAHYVQSAVFPGSTSPNNGDSYADRLWQRFQTDLDAAVEAVSEAVDSPPGVGGAGSVVGYSPAPFFPDEMRF